MPLIEYDTISHSHMYQFFVILQCLPLIKNYLHIFNVFITNTLSYKMILQYEGKIVAISSYMRTYIHVCDENKQKSARLYFT